MWLTVSGIQDSPAADYSLKPRAPLSFSNMLGMQLPPQDPMSSKADSGLKIRPVEKAEIVGQITPTPQFREIHESNDLPSKEHSAWQKEEMAALKVRRNTLTSRIQISRCKISLL